MMTNLKNLTNSNIEKLYKDELALFLETSKINMAITFNKVDAKNDKHIKVLCDKYDFNFENLTINKQIHSDIVRVINETNLAEFAEGDAFITNVANIPLMIFTADCVPILLFDNDTCVVGAVHAGWKGTYKNIVSKTIEKMKLNYNVNEKNLKAIIGPSIGPCCYEVSDDLIEKFQSKYKGEYVIYHKEKNKYHLNLWELNKLMLLNAGILNENIFSLDLCTSCNSDKFYSYRKNEKTLKRIGSIIQIKG